MRSRSIFDHSPSPCLPQLVFDDPEWTHVPAEAKSFVAACLTKQRDGRSTSTALLKHKWIAGVEAAFWEEPGVGAGAEGVGAPPDEAL